MFFLELIQRWFKSWKAGWFRPGHGHNQGHPYRRPLRRVIGVRRCEDDVDRPPPLRWTPCHPSTVHHFKATMTCPRGHVFTLRGHSIGVDGTVMPSVVCPARGCSFHTYVRLEDWTGGQLSTDQRRL